MIGQDTKRTGVDLVRGDEKTILDKEPNGIDDDYTITQQHADTIARSTREGIEGDDADQTKTPGCVINNAKDYIEQSGTNVQDEGDIVDENGEHEVDKVKRVGE